MLLQDPDHKTNPLVTNYEKVNNETFGHFQSP